MIDYSASTSEVVRIGIAEGAVAAAGGRLRTTGLGSCVGVVVYDVRERIAGMVHIMLPEAPNPLSESVNAAKYADSGIPWLLKKMKSAGANAKNLKCKIAGGAQMFAFAGKSDIMRVGPRNVDAVKTSLTLLGIPIIAQDVGGNVGRTIEFDVQSEELWIRTAMNGTYKI